MPGKQGSLAKLLFDTSSETAVLWMWGQHPLGGGLSVPGVTSSGGCFRAGCPWGTLCRGGEAGLCPHPIQGPCRLHRAAL